MQQARPAHSDAAGTPSAPRCSRHDQRTQVQQARPAHPDAVGTTSASRCSRHDWHTAVAAVPSNKPSTPRCSRMRHVLDNTDGSSSDQLNVAPTPYRQCHRHKLLRKQRTQNVPTHIATEFDACAEASGRRARGIGNAL